MPEPDADDELASLLGTLGIGSVAAEGPERHLQGQQGGWAPVDGLGLAGLRNEAGDYNCFLNVIIQCLWRCADFRQQVGAAAVQPASCHVCVPADVLVAAARQRAWPAGSGAAATNSPFTVRLQQQHCLPVLQVSGWDPAFYSQDAVLAALHGLFQQFEQQEQQRRSDAGSGSGGGGGALLPADPGPLREALAALPGQQFRVGEWAGGLGWWEGWWAGWHWQSGLLQHWCQPCPADNRQWVVRYAAVGAATGCFSTPRVHRPQCHACCL